jgi:hypothetical protein
MTRAAIGVCGKKRKGFMDESLIVAGIVAIFVNIPGAALGYSVLGLVIFNGDER